jgi:DNA-binding NarL/FixJ family response regulator
MKRQALASTQTVHGREPELGEALAFLTDQEPGVKVLSITGATGMGKTHLLDTALDLARQAVGTVLRAHANPDETDLDYVVLTDLVERVPPGALKALPGPQRRALEVASLRRHESPLEPVDRHAIGLGLLAVLQGLRSTGVLVVALDDATWLDSASAQVLAFALRRVGDQPVRVFLTTPSAAGARRISGDWQAASEHHITLGPLPEDAFVAIVGRHRAEVITPRRMARLHEAVGGNPALGLEILALLQDGPTAVGRTDRFPLPAKLARRLGARVERLAVDTTEALQVAAAMSVPSSANLQAALETSGWASLLHPAVDAGVISVRTTGIAFTEPLLSSLLYLQLPPRRRLQLHRRLSEVLPDPGERALHLALSSRRTDESVAAQIVVAADAAHAHGDVRTAAELTAEAARITPGDRSEELRRRAIDAAARSVASGDVTYAGAILETATGRMTRERDRAIGLQHLSRLRGWTDHLAAGVNLLRLSLDLLAPVDPLRARISAEMAQALALGGDYGAALRWVENALTMDTPTGSPDPAVLTVAAVVDLAVGTAERQTALEGLPDLREPLLPIGLRPPFGRAVLDVAHGRLDDARTALCGLHRATALAGDDLAQGQLVIRLCKLELVAGDWTSALSYAEEATTLARRTGQRVLLAYALSHRALVTARLGRSEETRRIAEEGIALAAATGTRPADWQNRWALGFLALSHGDADRASGILAPVADAAYAAGLVEPTMMGWVPDAVEALVAIGELDRAEEVLAPYHRTGGRLRRERTLAAAERSQALVLASRHDRDQALRLLEHAIARYRKVIDPFGLARALLTAGIIQRRARHEAEAGRLLQGALDLLDDLGATLWAERIRAELPVTAVRATAALTATEQRVADLAAQGLTNRQIASQLYVSPKTVEAHLSSIYRKLGIRSRAGLAHHLHHEAPPVASS